MRYYIHSTLTNSYNYTNWHPQVAPGHPLKVRSQVLIKGGANLATSPESRRGRFTPAGVMTEITEAQMEALEENERFRSHRDQGFIVVTSSKEDPDDIAKDMMARDDSAPLTRESAALQNPNAEEGLEAVVVTGKPNDQPRRNFFNRKKN